MNVRRDVVLAPYTTLRVGGPAERFVEARDADELAEAVASAHRQGERPTLIGWGSNVVPSDRGVPGLTVRNLTRDLRVDEFGAVVADSGVFFQELCLRTLQWGYRGFEYAVGIPGTVGGALVSNAGAYRAAISEFLVELEIVESGRRRWVPPAWMEFSYRDSVLRRPEPPLATVLRMRFRPPKGDPWPGYDEAREYQRQRISKQPPSPSAGSFFKNVTDAALAARLEGLPEPLRQKGIVPAGYLIEAAGLKGFRLGGVMLGQRHANFILNVGGGTGTEIRRLAELAKAEVRNRFGVTLEEEALYLGRWD